MLEVNIMLVRMYPHRYSTATSKVRIVDHQAGIDLLPVTAG